eukprot:CAMPEP_0170143078 /NCGR_PEP_ID=MMETSP0033_2-20121228/9416_1 /TAXON_ID=195969 /ORGANISM="Dolichomastix tenuilepis, Strain CCMP3274" /LENGTH=94 /DNA_ID=CAMNT_0010379501 /DNA_START=91 /DNA_END=372 /DNA_ORIENTATION=+
MDHIKHRGASRDVEMMQQDEEQLLGPGTDTLEFLADPGMEPVKAARGNSDLGVLADGWPKYLERSLKELVLGTRLNVLLVCIPMAMMARGSGDG